MPLGTASSFAITGYMFNNESRDFKNQFETLMGRTAIFVGAVWVFFNLIMREKPTIPPSQVATVPYRRLDFRESFSVMGENRNFLMLTIALALPFGSFTAIGALVSNLFDPFGYSSSELSFICL